MNLDEQKIKTLLSEVRTLKSYATRVEEGLEQLLQSGVGTTRKSQAKENKTDKIRQEIKNQLLRL